VVVVVVVVVVGFSFFNRQYFFKILFHLTFFFCTLCLFVIKNKKEQPDVSCNTEKEFYVHST
jgi:hypothetical protein